MVEVEEGAGARVVVAAGSHLEVLGLDGVEVLDHEEARPSENLESLKPTRRKWKTKRTKERA